MIRLLYNLLFPVALLFFLPRYFIKARRRGNYRRNAGQRFALYSDETKEQLANTTRTWIHAVSVGEVAVALKLATKLHELQPAFRCVLTTTTTTGYAFAEREAPPWMLVLYNPLDFWPVVRRAFSTIRPQQLILVEAEVWPNLTAIARARGVPIALVNARLSPRAEGRFRRFRAIVTPMFRCLDLVCVQERRDIDRWHSLGIPHRRIAHTGSIKYDPEHATIDPATPLQVLRDLGIDLSQTQVLFGGSTHPGEEEILARVYRQLREKFPQLLLVIAPRHVERTPEIRAELEQLGLTIALRSKPAERAAAECLLLDTTGELRNWYAIASVVFVGKSLTTRGGQNPVEPILAGKPVVFGPNMQNFRTLAESLLREGAAIQVQDEEALTRACEELLRHPHQRQQLVANAQRVLDTHRGATQRTAELLLALRNTSPDRA
jgi:3-deoxy-D-manno-octulosonic-acid transferase